MAKKFTNVGNYQLQKTIGEGNFAKVRLGIHLLTKQQVAVKIIDKSKTDRATLNKLTREIRAMKGLIHPNIVKLYEVIDHPTHVFLVMEYCSGGALYDYITAAHGRMKEKEARTYFREIVFAVEYCHNKSVIHRDLKLENLLLDHKMHVKVADFGFTNMFKKDQKLMTWCGSPPYAAPELFIGKPYTGPEVDVWSLGVVLFVLLCGALPFDGDTLGKVRTQVLQGKIKMPYYISSDSEDLIRKILVVDVESRYKISDIVSHKWFKDGFNVKEERDKNIKSQSLNDQFAVKAAQDCLGFGITSEKLKTSLENKAFDEVFATYQLLLEKHAASNFSASLANSNLVQDTINSRNLGDVVKQRPRAKTSPLLPQQKVLNSVNTLDIQLKLQNLDFRPAGFEFDMELKQQEPSVNRSTIESLDTARKFNFATSPTDFVNASILTETLQRSLGYLKIPYKQTGYIYHCTLRNLEFDVEICKIFGDNNYSLRHNLALGNVSEYKKCCHEILENLKVLKIKHVIFSLYLCG